MTIKRKFTHIKDILSSIGGAGGVKISQYQIWDSWADIVGEQIAKKSAPKTMRGTTLIVGVNNSAWVQELTMMKPRIMQKLKDLFPDAKIEEIRFELK